MGFILRNQFGRGWLPSADAIACPPEALLRADNLVLDELGIWALRQGSAKVNSVALADIDIHSLYTANLSGAKTRYAGAGAAVYRNGTSIASSIAGSGDIQFGSHMGQVLFARSTTKKKDDGTTVRNWGIAAPGSAPTIAVATADSKTFATCSSVEAPAFVANEGTIAFSTDRAGTANAAIEVTPDATTARGTITKTFAAATDFTAYDAGGVGVDEDLLDLYVYITEPQYLSSITLMIDVNDGTYEQDWYSYIFEPGTPIEAQLPLDRFLAYDYTVEGFERRDILSRVEDRATLQPEIRQDKPAASVGWNHFSVARGQMKRSGLTAGKNWSTVKALRLTFTGLAGGAGAAIRFDDVKIIGGAARPLTGKYKFAYALAKNFTTYTALSPVSAFSAEIELKAQGVTVTFPADAARDSQADEIWLYRMGGTMDGFYRSQIKTGVSGTGAFSVDDTRSDKDTLILNIKMETDTAVPPDSIVGITGPHYDRTFCLTATHLYPSRTRNPDSFGSDDAVRVGDTTETALWVTKDDEELYLGTTKDIYRISGDWGKDPDGTIRQLRVPLGVGSPPISSAFAKDGDVLMYLAADGWRVLGTQGTINGDVDLLYRGYTRHGVSPVNIGTATARFRCAITKGIFTAITPEGSDTTYSTTLHRYNFKQQRWYRHTYTPTWRCVYREPDGTLIASDAAGFVWTLDTGTQDGSTDIPVVLWTKVDDLGDGVNWKEPDEFRMQLDTAGTTATVNLHLDGSDTSAVAISASSSGSGMYQTSILALSEYRQLQLRITGSFSTFKLYDWSTTFVTLPPKVKIFDTGHVDLGVQDLVWVREVIVKCKTSVDLTVTPYFDGVASTPYTLTTVGNVTTLYHVGMGREYKGRQPRLIISAATGFHVFWTEFRMTPTKLATQRPKVRVGAAA